MTFMAAKYLKAKLMVKIDDICMNITLHIPIIHLKSIGSLCVGFKINVLKTRTERENMP